MAQGHQGQRQPKGFLHDIAPQRRWAGYGALGGALLVVALLILGARNAVTPSNTPTTPSTATTSSSAVQDYTSAERWRTRQPQHCDRAIPLYLQAILKNSMYVNVYNGLALCYLTLGSYNEAILEYNRAIAIDPTNFGLYLYRAGAEVASGNTGAATKDDLIAVQYSPHQSPSYSSIAASFATFGDFADALTTINKAIALVPKDSALFIQRAGIYLGAKDYTHAFADYQQALSVAPYFQARVNIYSNIALAYDQEGDFSKAYQAISTAIQLLPTNIQFYVTAAGIYKDNSDFPKAYQDMHKAILVQPHNGQLYLTAAGLHQYGGDNKSALSYYDGAIHYGGTGSVAEKAHEAKGDLLAQMGHKTAAVGEYRKALQLTSKTDQAAQAGLQNKINATLSGQS